jgi:hypothetical protein
MTAAPSSPLRTPDSTLSNPNPNGALGLEVAGRLGGEEEKEEEKGANGVRHHCHPVTLPPNALLKLVTEEGPITAPRVTVDGVTVQGTQARRHVLVFEGPPSELQRDIQVGTHRLNRRRPVIRFVVLSWAC